MRMNNNNEAELNEVASCKVRCDAPSAKLGPGLRWAEHAGARRANGTHFSSRGVVGDSANQDWLTNDPFIYSFLRY